MAEAGEQAGDVIGRYTLRERLGEGGFGAVWMAEQDEPIERQVALKIVKLGMDTKEVLARFDAERQALAMMDHPHIARVLDAGATELGRPFFVMDLVRGIPITRFCEEERLGSAERLELFRRVCDAVQHAHHKGIIHRDLKPSNVLVTWNDGEAAPVVIDFGIAKATGQRLTEKTLFTQYGKFVGTPEYMAPEQAEMSGLDVDTRADVYSLGVLLYQLVTGTVPFDLGPVMEKGYAEVVRVIREQEPTKPSTRISTLGEAHPARRRMSPARMRGELDWIVMKAIEKERRRRYDTASALAMDIGRYLAHQPVVAGPPSALYRMRKYVRRHRVGVVAGGVVAVSVLAGLAAATLGFVEASEQRDLAEASAREARIEATRARTVADLLTGMLSAADPLRLKGPDFTVRELLDEFSASLGDELDDQPAVAATVHAVMGMAYNHLGALDKAEHHLERAIADGRATPRGDREQEVAMLAERAWVDHHRGEYETARVLLEQADRVWQELQVEPDHIRCKILSYRADIARHQGDLELAEELGRQSLGLMGQLGDDRGGMATAMHVLGWVLEARGSYSEAEAMFRAALERKRIEDGEEHPDTQSSVVGLARIVAAQGRPGEAEAMLRDAVPKLREIYAGSSPQLAAALYEMANVRLQLGAIDEAEELYREALGMRRQIHGEHHVDVATVLDDLSVLLVRRGQRDEALAMAKDALAMRLDLLGEDDAYSALSLHNVGFIHLQRGELDQAEVLYRRALEVKLRILGADHPHIAQTASGLGWTLLRQDRLAAAEVEFRRAVDAARNAGVHPLELAGRVAPLGLVLLQQGKYGEAEAAARESLEIREAHQPGSWSTYNAMSLLGACLMGQDKLDEAEPLLVESYEKMEPPPGAAARKREALQRVVELYERWGKQAEAEEWRKR